MKLRIVGSLALLTLALGACTTTEEAQQVLQSRWIGQPVDNFFMRYGPPYASYQMGNGGEVFSWHGGDKTRYIAPSYTTGTPATTTVQTTPTPGGGMQTTTVRTPGTMPQMISPGRVDELFCEIQITTDSTQRIAMIRATNDTDGAGMSLSRCAEVLDAHPVKK